MHRGLLLVAGLLLLVGLGAGVVGAGSTTQENRTVRGTVYPVPAEIEATALDTARSAAEQWGYDQPAEVALLYTDSGDTYIVGFAGPVAPGRYTVSGPGVSPAESGSDLGVILSTDSSRQEPEVVRFDELQTNTDEYANRHVVTRAQATAVTFRYDTSGVSSQQSVGSLASERGAADLLQPPGRAARFTLFNLTAREGSSLEAAREGAFRRAYRSTGPDPNGTYAYGDRRFWTNGRADVGLLVLPQDAPTGFDERIFFTTDVRPIASTTVTPAELRANPDAYRGELVTVTGDAAGASISTQETLLSVAECAPESITVPASPPFCAPVPMDIVVHTGGVVSADSPGAPIPYVGLSNVVQDQPIAVERGQYRLTGRVVAADEAVPRANASVALLVMDRERTGDISVRSDELATADDLADEMRQQLRSQLRLQSSEYQSEVEAAQSTPTPAPAPKPTKSPTVDATETVTPEPAGSPTDGRSTGDSGNSATPIKDYALYDVMAASIDKDTVAPGEPLTATLVLRNPDPIETKATITVSFDFNEIEKEVTIPANSRKTVEFTFDGPQRREGTVSATLVRLTGDSYTIGTAEIVPRSTDSPTNATGDGFGLTGGIVVLAVYAGLMKRRC